jgi:hypothetical protein
MSVNPASFRPTSISLLHAAAAAAVQFKNKKYLIAHATRPYQEKEVRNSISYAHI